MPRFSDISVIGWESDVPVDTVNITFIWDGVFNDADAITKYFISVTYPLISSDGTNIVCPGTCFPDEMCMCSGSLAKTGVNVNIKAANCEEQWGPQIVITIKSMWLRYNLC